MTRYIILIVAIVGVLGTINLFGMTGALVSDGSLFVSGYIDDNNDYNDPMCKSRMTAIAQPGDKVIGQGRVTGIRYFIDLLPGWEQSNNIEFLVYDSSPVLCTSVPISKFEEAVDGQISLDLRCRFENINCFYYIEYDPIDDQAKKYWSKVGYIGGARVYR